MTVAVWRREKGDCFIAKGEKLTDCCGGGCRARLGSSGGRDGGAMDGRLGADAAGIGIWEAGRTL